MIKLQNTWGEIQFISTWVDRKWNATIHLNMGGSKMECNKSPS